MLLAGVLLGAFVGFVAACLVIAARRGLWLMVEIDQRTHRTTTVAHDHTHHHVLHPDHAFVESRKTAIRVPRPPLRGELTRPTENLHDLREIQ